MPVKVTTQGGETQEVEYTEKMRVSGALKEAGIQKSRKATISVGGKDASLKTVVNDGDHIVVTPKISNG